MRGGNMSDEDQIWVVSLRQPRKSVKTIKEKFVARMSVFVEKKWNRLQESWKIHNIWHHEKSTPFDRTNVSLKHLISNAKYPKTGIYNAPM